jgi:hypothetical protein
MKKVKWILFCVVICLLTIGCFAAMYQKKFSTYFMDSGDNIISITCTEINKHEYIIVAGSGIAITHDMNCKYCNHENTK